MKTFLNPIYNEDNLIGLDYEISLLQKKLAIGTFIEAIFGIAHTQYKRIDDSMVENTLNQKEGSSLTEKYRKFFPEGRKFGTAIDLSFSDQYASMCFFLANDPIKWTKSDWTDNYPQLEQPFSFLFFSNTDKLEAISKEQVKNALIALFNAMPKVIVKQMYEGIDDIWRGSGFTMTQQIQSMSKPPYYCLKIDATLTYLPLPNNGNTAIYNPNPLFDPSQEQETIINVNPGYANTN